MKRRACADAILKPHQEGGYAQNEGLPRGGRLDSQERCEPAPCPSTKELKDFDGHGASTLAWAPGC